MLAILTVSPLLRWAALRYGVPSGTASRTGCDACGAPIGLTRPWPALGPAGRCGR
ncbi:prepilin peptidase, partial [Micromonospora sp. CV4]